MVTWLHGYTLHKSLKTNALAVQKCNQWCNHVVVVWLQMANEPRQEFLPLLIYNKLERIQSTYYLLLEQYTNAVNYGV